MAQSLNHFELSIVSIHDQDLYNVLTKEGKSKSCF